MRRLLLSFAVAGIIMGTGAARAAPVLHLTGWKATAGKPETATITRIGGNGPATVTFKTGAAGDVAQPNVDYGPVNQTILWAKGQTTATVTIPTFVNGAYLGKNITFTGTLTGPNGTSGATFLIMEPPPVVTANIPDLGQSWCPSATKLCHTETATQMPIGWVDAPLMKGGYARPLNLLYCAGAIVKIEALDGNAYINEPLLTDWTGKSFDPGPDRVWAVHFVNDAGGKCADTGWTVVMFTHDLQGLALAQ